MDILDPAGRVEYVGFSVPRGSLFVRSLAIDVGTLLVLGEVTKVATLSSLLRRRLESFAGYSWETNEMLACFHLSAALSLSLLFLLETLYCISTAKQVYAHLCRSIDRKIDK